MAHPQYRGTFSLELVRKIVHILVGVLIVLGFNSHLLDLPLLFLILMLFAATVLYNLKAEIELLTNILSINRADATVPGLDILFYFIGCFIVLWLFPLQIASAAILILAFGDAIAHLISRSFGGTQTVLTKTTYLEGTIAGIVAGTLAAWLYVPLLPAFLASAASMLVEAGELNIENHHIDDNLVVPIVAALLLALLALIFPTILF
jgi:dolichol kinase